MQQVVFSISIAVSGKTTFILFLYFRPRIANKSPPLFPDETRL